MSRDGEAFNAVWDELERAREKFPTFGKPHYGYAMLLEELDELWDAIKKDDIPAAKAEAVQVAAMAIRFLMETEDVPGLREHSQSKEQGK